MTPDRLRRWAAVWRRTPLHPQWLHCSPREHLPELDLIGPGMLLDVGCAEQWLRRRLPERVEYVSLDYPPIGAVRYAARPMVFGDAQALPLRTGSIDTVAMLEVIEHIPDPDRALGEVRRVLRPGGLLILSAPFAYPLHDQPHDYRRFTDHGLTWLLSRHGFDVQQVRAISGSVAAAALGLNLAIASSVLVGVQRNVLAGLWVLLAAPAILVLNLGAWIAQRLLPESGILVAGYVIVGRCVPRAEGA